LCGGAINRLENTEWVVCGTCLSVNIPVTVVTAQAACARCKKLAYRQEGSLVIKCTCGCEMDVIRCTACKGQFSALYTPSYPKMMCPSKCGDTLVYDSLQIKNSLPKKQRQTLLYSEINMNSFPEDNTKKSYAPHREISLIIQYYKDNSRERQKEIDMCIVNNACNRYISTVHVLLEKNGDFDDVKFNSPKIKIHSDVVGKRLSFDAAIRFANKKLPGHICILANCDVYFDYSLSRLSHTPPLHNQMLALSRYDVKDNGVLMFNTFLAPYSQDAWIFTSPVAMEGMSVDFKMGYLGCDNRISYEFNKVGYKVTNPCLPCTGIIVRHVHKSEKRNYTETDRIEGGYLPVFPCEYSSNKNN